MALICLQTTHHFIWTSGKKNVHLFLNNNIHHSSRHLVQALCASAEPLELSVHYPELPSSEPVTGETNADKPY